MDYFALYWTLPVPWVGFKQLPSDPDEAAKASRTIRYQVERVRRWVAAEKGRLLGESVFMELQADRGTHHIVPLVEKLVAKAENAGAGIVAVNFAEALGWRPHYALWGTLEGSGRVTALDPTPLVLEHETLDPVAHFREWREREDRFVAGKEERKVALAETIRALRESGLSFPVIAEVLNGEGQRTANGKPWTGDNVRKMLGAGPGGP
jgi:hypothetical protein